MRIFITFILITVSLFAQGQDSSLITTVLNDTNTYSAIKFFPESSKLPDKLYLLNQTSRWQTNRFVIEGIRFDFCGDWFNEYSPYNTEYIFKDCTLNKLFDSLDRVFLIEQALHANSISVNISAAGMHTVKSFEQVKSGYLIEITTPIYSLDKKYGFIDIEILNKNNQ